MLNLRGRLLGIVAHSILLVSAVAYAAPNEEALLIVDGAQNLSRIPRSAVERQIGYTMNLTYPEGAIGEAQWRQLKQSGWVRCHSVDPGQAAANSDWVDFIDGTVRPERTIHQHLSYWLKGDQMISIGLRYYSKTQDGHATPTPDNTEQHVYLIFDDERGREMAELLELDCAE